MKKQFETKLEILFWVLTIAMWIALYWKQCVIDNLNDFYCHNVFAKLVVEGKLVLVYPVYHIMVGMLAKLTGMLETQASVYVLTFAQVLSVIVMAELLKALSDIWKSRMELLIVSFMLNVVQPIFFYNYKPGASSGNGLFSPTLTMVKPFVLLTFLLFYKMYKNKEYTFRNQTCFFVSMLLTCLIKPMFTMAFIPAIGILLLIEAVDNLKSDNSKFREEFCRLIIKVIPLFIIGLILIAQFVFTAYYDVPTDVLPEGVNLSSDKDSHIRIGYMRSWRLAVSNVYISLVLTYFFALVVLFVVLYYSYMRNTTVTDIVKASLRPFKNITISYGIISFLYMAFLYQEGREIDMNFRNAWVVTFNLVYILAFVHLKELNFVIQARDEKLRSSEYSFLTWTKRNPLIICSYLALGIHILFGAALVVKYIHG